MNSAPPRLKFSKPLLVIVVCAIILTAGVGIVLDQLENRYLDNYPYFYDAVSYSLYNTRLYYLQADEGRIDTAIREAAQNARMPLRTVPLILFAPELLIQRTGYLATALPALGVFLSLLAWSVYRRAHSLVYALAVIVLFCALPGIYDPQFGLGAYWLDLPAALWVGAGVLCLLNSDDGRDLRWLAGFALCVSLAALSRYVAAADALVIGAPILAYYLLRRWRAEGNAVKSIIIPSVLVLAIVMLVAGAFLIGHLSEVASFYTTYGYATFQDVKASARHVLTMLQQFVGSEVIVTLVALLGISLVLTRRELRQNWLQLLVMGWVAVAVLIYLVLVIRVVGDRQAPLYALPGLFILAVSPIAYRSMDPSRRVFQILGAAILTMSLLLGVRAVLRYNDWALNPYPEAREEKALDIALAQAVIQQGDRVVWNTYFDEYGWIPTMEAFYRFGELPLPAGQDYFFSIHETVYKGNYPGLAPEQVAPLLYENTRRFADVVVIFADPAQADSRFNNEYSRAAARYIAHAVQNDAQWVRVFEIESNKYGPIAGYRNLKPADPGAYAIKLRGQMLPVKTSK